MRNYILWTFFLISISGYSSTWEKISQSKKIRLATEGAYAPFNYYKDGKLTGFEVELLDAIVSKLGLSFDWKVSSFDSLLIGLGAEQDRYDLVAASHSITPERENAVEFTDPHYCTQVVIVTLGKPLTTVEELRNKKVAVQVGTVGVPVLKTIQGLGEIKTFPKDPDAMQALAMGRADAWVTDKPVAQEAKKVHSKLNLQIGTSIAQMKVGMAATKGNKALVQKINEGLKNLQKEGFYSKLSQKYFGEDISCR